MTAQMTAYRLLEWEQAPQLVEVAVPAPGPGQVLIRIAGNGLCHSDIGMGLMPASIGELVGWSMPFTLGHEIGGHVEEIGEGAVDTYGRPITVGQAVALVSPSSCGVCRYCRRGLDSACPNGLAGRGLRGRRCRPVGASARERRPAGRSSPDRCRLDLLPRRQARPSPAGARLERRRARRRRPRIFRHPADPCHVAGPRDRRRPAHLAA